jgi:hypothetical protein
MVQVFAKSLTHVLGFIDSSGPDRFATRFEERCRDD